MATREPPLNEHIFGTYFALRMSMVVFGILLPIVVVSVGLLFYGISLQPSISDYYWASPTKKLFDTTLFDQTAPSRVWFVGGIFAIAACLVVYRGFSPRENNILNIAALLAVGVAIFPMCKATATVQCGQFSLHGICAIAMFGCLCRVIWKHAKDTLKWLPHDAKPNAKQFETYYQRISVTVMLLPVAAFVVNYFAGESIFILVLETLSIWTFAAYWWVKSWELSKSRATRKALRGEQPAARVASAEGRKEEKTKIAPPRALAPASVAAAEAAGTLAMALPSEGPLAMAPADESPSGNIVRKAVRRVFPRE